MENLLRMLLLNLEAIIFHLHNIRELSSNCSRRFWVSNNLKQKFQIWGTAAPLLISSVEYTARKNLVQLLPPNPSQQ